ncbi:MAG: histidinol-phosphate aminotransferase family protein [Acidobacteria bacterium]|nr:histidinol-phosphate aminotransferase family protein [Acidobacteriota bacterium]MCA1648757.1 histidinol-phosphate aminotransferase family protein [Acidobacteriota bacterium]
MSYEYERVAAPRSGLRLHLNENTAGCSPRVLAALQTMTREDAAFYPDYTDAIEACAGWLGVAHDRVLLTNGLDEGILAASVAAMRGSEGERRYEAVVVVPAFDMYAACVDAAGGRVVEVPLGPDFSFDGDAVMAAVTSRTRLVFLTNPNNPTGQAIRRDAILAIADHASHAIVFLDEAYADFAGDTLIGDAALDRLPNIIVGRTFAKAWGLAGLRVGALIGSTETMAPLRRVVPPYSINAYAARALPAALDDRDYYDWYLDQVRTSKGLLYDALRKLSIPFWQSGGNFVLARFGSDAARVLEGAAARQVFLRDRSRDPGCEGCVRIGAGVIDHTEACIAAIREVLCGAP